MVTMVADKFKSSGYEVLVTNYIRKEATQTTVILNINNPQNLFEGVTITALHKEDG